MNSTMTTAPTSQMILFMNVFSGLRSRLKREPGWRTAAAPDLANVGRDSHRFCALANKRGLSPGVCCAQRQAPSATTSVGRAWCLTKHGATL